MAAIEFDLQLLEVYPMLEKGASDLLLPRRSSARWRWSTSADIACLAD